MNYFDNYIKEHPEIQTPDYLLKKFEKDKSNGFNRIHWDVIPAKQYYNCLKDFAENGEFMRFPERILRSWLDLICHNAILFDFIEFFLQFLGESDNIRGDVTTCFFIPDGIDNTFYIDIEDYQTVERITLESILDFYKILNRDETKKLYKDYDISIKNREKAYNIADEYLFKNAGLYAYYDYFKDDIEKYNNLPQNIKDKFQELISKYEYSEWNILSKKLKELKEKSINILKENNFLDWVKDSKGNFLTSSLYFQMFEHTFPGIIRELNTEPTKEQMVVTINRCMDVAHNDGDLTELILEGGHEAATKISNGTLAKRIFKPSDIDILLSSIIYNNSRY